MALKNSIWFAKLFGAKHQTQPESNAYHAVSILPGCDACAGARRLCGPRFLSRNAPRLPLAGCDAKNCECRFKHHRDRRSGSRRSSDMGMMSAAYSNQERRSSRGRRCDDRL